MSKASELLNKMESSKLKEGSIVIMDMSGYYDFHDDNFKIPKEVKAEVLAIDSKRNFILLASEPIMSKVMPRFASEVKQVLAEHGITLERSEYNKISLGHPESKIKLL